jgi:hypothetical protein
MKELTPDEKEDAARGVVDEIYYLFQEAERTGATHIELTSALGAKFHATVMEAKRQVKGVEPGDDG